MGGSFSGGKGNKGEPKQSGRTFVNSSDKDQNDYETDMYSKTNMDNQSGRRDLLIYLFGEDTDGMKIVSWDPVKHQLKHKRVPKTPKKKPKNIIRYQRISKSGITRGVSSWPTTKSALQAVSIKTRTKLQTSFTYTTRSLTRWSKNRQ